MHIHAPTYRRIHNNNSNNIICWLHSIIVRISSHRVLVVGLRALRSGGLYGREQFITLLFNYHWYIHCIIRSTILGGERNVVVVVVDWSKSSKRVDLSGTTCRQERWCIRRLRARTPHARSRTRLCVTV